MWEPESDSFLGEDDDDTLGPLGLVFAQDVYSPRKLVCDNGLYPYRDLITDDSDSPEWTHGVIIAEGEPVTRETLRILEAAGIDCSVPVRLARLPKED